MYPSNEKVFPDTTTVFRNAYFKRSQAISLLPIILYVFLESCFLTECLDLVFLNYVLFVYMYVYNLCMDAWNLRLRHAKQVFFHRATLPSLHPILEG